MQCSIYYVNYKQLYLYNIYKNTMFDDSNIVTYKIHIYIKLVQNNIVYLNNKLSLLSE